VAGVALMALGWVWWRAWSPLVAQCRGVALGTGLGLVARLVAANAWHLATATFVLRGRRGSYGTGLGLVACLVAVSRP